MKKYEFKPYNPDYPTMYAEEKNRLTQFLSGDYLIEHIGSTAVPGLGGKGIIDMMISVSKVKMEKVSQLAQKAGYVFRPLASTETRLFLRTEYPEDFSKENAYHLHITFSESNDWRETLAFRDHLRTHPEDLNRYAEAKNKAAQEANENTAKYKKLKENIMQEIIHKALEEKCSKLQ